ncbi:MAG: hypothetical protein ACFFD5_10715 [Candidatus Thorarchaeota archaeon]
MHFCIKKAKIYKQICLLFDQAKFCRLTMPSENKDQDEIEQKTPRVSVKLDEFDYKVINKMAENRNISLSKSINNIVHQWIETNPDILKENYGVDFKEITQELVLDTASLSYDKSLKAIEKEIIEELPTFFEMVESVSISDLADHFDVPVKSIKKIFYTHGKKIKSLGLNLSVKEGYIYRE